VWIFISWNEKIMMFSGKKMLKFNMAAFRRVATRNRALSDNFARTRSNMEAKIAQHVQVLSGSTSDENVLKSLQDLNILVDSRSLNSEQLLTLIPPGLLFRRLALNHKSEISHCAGLLKKLLNYMKPELIITEYEVAAMQGVNHPSVEVRELCLSQVERCVQTNSGVLRIIQNLDLVSFVIRNLSHSHMGCAKVASSILLNISRHGDGLALLLDTCPQAEFAELMNEGNTICFRVYELFVKIFEANQNSYEQFRPIFTRLAAEVDSDDVLIQMNCIELLTDLVTINKVAYKLPEETGVNQKLYSILISAESNPLAALLIPGRVANENMS
jgi:26S proteasome non-ATPase regulatory subunit 5